MTARLWTEAEKEQEGGLMEAVCERANPDPSKWHASSKRALAIMEETVGSLRIAKINDDGAPDPFVVERVEPAPLPDQEKRPSL